MTQSPSNSTAATPSISLVSESLFHVADCLLVPTIPTTLSMRTLEQLRGHLATIDGAPLVLPFFGMVDRRKTMHRELCDAHRGRDGFRTFSHARGIYREGVDMVFFFAVLFANHRGIEPAPVRRDSNR